MFKNLERKMLEGIHEKIKIEQHLDEDTLVYHTKTMVDGICVHEHEFDLSRLMVIMEKRLLKQLLLAPPKKAVKKKEKKIIV